MQCIDLQHKPYVQLDGGAIVSMLVRQAAGQAVSLELIQISKLQSSNSTPNFKFDFKTQIIKPTLTASTGKEPAAVSPLSMTQSVPSSTALATSVASARVGRGFLIILSSICVAVMTGLPACAENRAGWQQK